MPDNYIVEILLTATDRASEKIKGLQRTVDELKAKAAASDLGQGLGDMADEADRAEKSHRDLSKAQQDHQRTMQQSESDLKRQGKALQEGADAAGEHAESSRQLNEQHDELQREAPKTEAAVKRVGTAHAEGAKQAAENAAAHSDLGAGLRDTAAATDEVSTAQERLAKRTEQALGDFDELSNSFREGSGDLRTLRTDLQASGQELQSLSKRFETLGEDARGLRAVSEDAAAMSKQLSTMQSSSRQPILGSLGIDKARQDLNALTRDFERHQQVVSRSTDQGTLSQAMSRTYASRFGSIASRLPAEAPELQTALANQLSAKRLATPISAAAAEPASAMQKASDQGGVLLQRMSSLDAAARNHTATNKELATGYSQVASGLRSVVKEMDVGSAAFDKFGLAAEDAGKKAKNIDFARSGGGMAGFAQTFAAATDQVGVKIISLSAALRGLKLVSVVGLIQPLLTGMMSLVGGFAGIASGAAQAAATIGGVFISSLGQLIPMVSIGVAALIRLRDVFQAVQAAQAANEEAFFQPNQGLITQLQNTNQLIESEQNLKNAYYGLQDAQVQVRESQMQLTQARIDAIRNLQDLVIAEKSAELQSKESNLAVTQAEQSLRAAQATGSQQGIQQAQLALQSAKIQQQQAKLGVPRAQQNLALAQGYGIAGSPEVLSATEGARQAQLAVQQQQQAISEAQRQMQITTLTLAQPASHMTQQQATLAYLKSQMSAPELTLFDMLNSMETQLRSPNSPLKKLSDYIIQPFTTAFSALDKVLSNQSFMGPITKLAQAMGGGLQKILGAMFGKGGTSFFETMATDATKSIPIITGAILGIMHVFEDFAKAAAPAMLRLSGDWDHFWNTLDAKERTPAGQARLEAFFDKGAKWAEDFAHLAGSIGRLMMALGHDAAPQGMKSVTSLTEGLQDATKWVQSHGPEVSNFFSQMEKGLSLIGGVLLSIGKLFVAVFNLSSLSAFTQLINGILLPAIANVANALGAIVRLLMDGVNFQFKIFGVTIRPIADILTSIATAIVGIMVVNKVIGGVTALGKAFLILKGAIAGFSAGEGVLGKIGGFFKGGSMGAKGLAVDGSEMITAADKMQKAADTMAGAAEKMGAAGAEEEAAGVEQETAAATEVTATTELSVGEATLGGGGVAGLGAEGVAGGGLLAGTGGLLAGVAPLALPAALLAGGYFGTKLLQKPTDAKKGTGLAALLGRVGGSHYDNSLVSDLGAFSPFSGHFGDQAVIPNQNPATAGALRSLQHSLSGVTNPSQLTTNQLQQYYNQALKIQQMPDITATQRRGLGQLIGVLNPATVAMQNAATTWGSTFSGISATTGSVMTQVQATLKTDIQNISTNLGTGTQQGQQALTTTFANAMNSLMDNTTKAARSTQTGMKTINSMLNSALKAMGEPAIDFAGVSKSPGAGGMSLSTLKAQGNADGGWNKATPGGMVYRAGEGGHDEVTLTTDPSKAPRQRQLLGQYFARAPHLAIGGMVNPVPGWAPTRVDQGVDGTLSTAGFLAPAQSRILIADSSNAGWGGGGYVAAEITKGPYTGRVYYVAEGIRPAVGITPGKVVNAGTDLVIRSVSPYNGILGNVEAGWAQGNNPGTPLAQSLRGYSGDQSSAAITAGSSFNALIGTLGGLTGHVAAGAGGINNSLLKGLPAGFAGGPGGGAMSAGAALAALIAPKVGVTGPMGEIAQRTVNLATKAANKFLSSFGVGTGAGGGATSTKGVAPGSWLKVARELAARMGWNAAQVQAWQGVENIEDSAYSLTAQNPTSSAYGLAQGITGPGWYATEGGNATTIVGQLTAMANYIKQRYGNPTAALAHEHSAGWYAAGGLLAKHVRRTGIRHLRKSVMRFADGGRAPWGGEPVPIIAHEGERISNPAQWGEVARMSGTTPAGLDRHLGYDGTPRQSFAPGGIATMQPGAGSTTTPSMTNLSSINSFLQNLTGNLYTMDLGSVSGSLDTITKLVSVINAAFAKIGKLGGANTTQQMNQIGTLLENFADPSNTSNTLALLAATFQRFQNNLSNWVTGLSYSAKTMMGTTIGPGQAGIVTAGQTTAGIDNAIAHVVTQHGIQTVQGTGDDVALAGRLGVGNIGHTGQTASDLLGERSLVEQQQYNQGLSKSVGAAITKVQSKIKEARSSTKLSPAARDKAVKDLQSIYTSLVGQQETLENSINSSITSRFQQEQTYVQDSLNQVADIFQTQAQQLQATQSGQQALGQYSALPSTDAAIAASSQQQISALQKVLVSAQKINDPDLVAQIQQQISQVQTTMSQALAQMVQDQLSAVEQTFQTQSAAQQSQQSIAQSMGNYAALPGIDQAIVDTTNAHIAALQQVLAAATASGNQGVAATVAQEISQLQATVQQTAAQMIQDAMSGIQQQASTDQAKVSMMQSISQTMTGAAATPGQFGAAGALNLQALNLNQTSLQGQISGYNSLLGTAIDQGNTGAVATLTQQIDQLTAQLYSNYQAIQDNTVQITQQTAQFIQARGQFQTGVYGGLSQIIQTIGQTTGYTDVASLKSLTTAANTSLQGTQGGLLQQLSQLGGGATGLSSLLGGTTTPQGFVAALGGANIGGIESGQDQAWISTFETLVNNLEQNTSAIATNNQQLAVLNGQLLQPQQWATSAWTQFRSAIFSGMGNLLPQFQSVLPTGAAPTIAPVFNPISGNSNSPTIGTLNVNHAPTTQLSPQLIGQQLAHETSTSLG